MLCVAQCAPATAEDHSKLRLLKGECTAIAPLRTPDLNYEMWKVVSKELTTALADPTTPGSSNYTLVDSVELMEARQRIQRRNSVTPGDSNARTKSLWRDLAAEVHADALLEVSYLTARPVRGRSTSSVMIKVIDTATGEQIITRAGESDNKRMAYSLVESANWAIRECLRPKTVRTTIKSRNAQGVTLPIGRSDRVYAGDEFTVVRNTKSPAADVGRIKIVRVSESEAEADILKDLPGGMESGAICTYFAGRGPCLFVPAGK